MEIIIFVINYAMIGWFAFLQIPDEICWQAQIRAFTQGALSAGIPIPVIQGKKILRDYFSQDYINFKCNKDK